MLRKVVGLSDHTLLKNRENVILIQDTKAQTGRPLLKTILKSMLDLVDEVHVFLYEIRTEHILKGLEESSERIHCHNMMDDSLCWHGLSANVDIEQQLSKLPTNIKVAVVIDTLSRLILDRSAAYTCKLVNRITCNNNNSGPSVHSVLTLLHTDLHPPLVPEQIKYTSDVILTVHPITSQKQYSARCSTLVRKPGGKVVRSEEMYLVSSTFHLLRADPVCDVMKRDHVTVSQETNQIDPAANLTFNLRLTEAERAARSQVQLPYTLNHNSKALELGNRPNTGQIYYQPDDVDDWDEEDPDDDLNI